MAAPAVVLTPEQLLAHWQGHRRVTRRLIEAFPADQFETFSIGGMRSFSALVQEMLAIAVPSLRGFVHKDWTTTWEPRALSKADALKEWDAATAEIDALFPKIRPEQWQQHDKAFGMYEGPIYDLFLYAVDNEVHHRGQAYVYLRALGIQPPEFFNRS